MIKILKIIFLLLISVQAIGQIDEYKNLMIIAKQNLDTNEFITAFKYYNKARNKGIGVKAISDAKKMADSCQKLIQEQKENLEIEKANAEEARDKAETIVGAMHFYNDTLAMAYKDNKYGFINKEGYAEIDYDYNEARPFSYPGLAKVKRDNKNYLIDAKQNEYRLGEGLEDADTIEALDFSNSQLTSVKNWVFDSTQLQNQLQILLLSGNEIDTLQTKIDALQALKMLIANDNEFKKLPPKIGFLSNLEILDVANNYLIEMPATMEHLTSLRILVLFNNQLTELPDFKDGGNKLEFLDASNNLLMDLLPASNSNLINLKVLYLENNLFEVYPEGINNLASIEELKLGGNQLDSLPEDLKQHSTNLRYLDLWNNSLEGKLEGIADLESLETLVLSHNKLEYYPGSIDNLTNLKLLDLSYNPDIKKLDLTNSQKPNLKILDLSYTGLVEFLFGSNSFDSLIKLNLDGNKLKMLPDSIGTVKSLKILYLSNNNLDTISPSIGSLNELTKLYLYNNKKLTDLPIEIKKLKKLKTLDLRNTQISFENLKKIDEWLPKCQVIYGDEDVE